MIWLTRKRMVRYPKAQSPYERRPISCHELSTRTSEVGGREIARVGLRNLNVDTVVRACGISKGSFYNFFPSKEAFILGVFGVVEKQARLEMEEALAEPFDNPAEQIGRFLRFVFHVLERQPILALLGDPEEAAYLMRSIPPEVWMKNKADDDQYFGRIVARWRKEGVVEGIDTEVIIALPRVAMALFQQKEMIGADRYAATVELLVESLADRLAKKTAGRATRHRKKRKG